MKDPAEIVKAVAARLPVPLISSCAAALASRNRFGS
jgi:hypothetical protein